MMGFSKLGALGLCALTLSLSAVSARDLKYTVSPGKRTLVSSYAMYDAENCTFGAIPVGKVVTPPQGGKIEMLEERRVVDGGNCGKIQGWARNVYYTAKPGFRGEDSFRVDFQYNKFTDAPALVSDTDNITVFVK